MSNFDVIEQTLESYELANQALLCVWDRLNGHEIDMILEKQQHRLEQITERLFHEEKTEDEFDETGEMDVICDTLDRYDRANRHLYEFWDTIPFDQRLDAIRKQWNRLQDLRNRIVH